MDELLKAIGKYACEMGEQWRMHEGVEIMDAYHACLEKFYKEKINKIEKVLTDNEIKLSMKNTESDRCCCNSYWPVTFARAIEKKVLNKLKGK